MSLRRAAMRVKTATVQRPVGRLLHELLRNERLPVDELRALQLRRAAEMARFAMDHTSFYRARFTAAGFSAADLASGEFSFSDLPTIEKPDLRDRGDSIRSDEASKSNVRVSYTGGSTGVPMSTLIDRRVPMIALSWRMRRWWGVAEEDDTMHLTRWKSGALALTWQRIRWWPTRQVFVDPTIVDEKSLRDFVATWRRHPPVLLEGYVGTMTEIAEHVADLPERLPPPVAVGTTAAPLAPSVRNRISSVFGAPVYDQYRTVEVPWLAGECRAHAGLHVFADMRLIEVVDDAGRPVPDGEEGEVVITDLANRVFPIVRYRVGDRATMLRDACPCGVTLPLMSSVGGRVLDMIVLPDGAVIASGVTVLFSHRPDAVHQFQVHQHADYSITLRVRRGPAIDADEVVAGVAHHLRSLTRQLVPVRVEFVDVIPSHRGKMRYVLSDVPRPVPDETVTP